MNNKILPLIILAAAGRQEMIEAATGGHDWSSRPTRYAKRSFMSQKKRRINARRRQSFSR